MISSTSKVYSPVRNNFQRGFRNRLKSLGRKALLTTALVGGCLTMASIVKTPKETLNPFVSTWHPYSVDHEHPASSNVLEDPQFGWNNSESIKDNIGNNIKAANNKLFTEVIDPIAEKPILPTTITALSMLGCIATLPKEGNTNNPDKAKTESV